MLPSGMTTLLKARRPSHPLLAFTFVHETPLFVDRQVSLVKPGELPPINTMLPSGNATLLCSNLGDHPELAFTCVHVSP
jgi:hypothetical protein